MSDLDLMRFFEFDNADLAANRMGKLSDKQAREINTSNQKAYRSGFGYIVFLVLLGAFISFLLLQDSPSPRTIAGGNPGSFDFMEYCWGSCCHHCLYSVGVRRGGLLDLQRHRTGTV